MRHSTLQFEKNTVTKISAPHLMRIEIEKTRRAFEIATASDLFRVPRVLEYDESQGKAIFERLDIRPISKAVPWGKPRMRLASILGTALATIHRELVLPDDMQIALPTKFASSQHEVFLHGDLSVDNVCVGPTWPPITVVDWQMTPNYGGQATYGTRYFDILWFIGNLFCRPYTRFLFTDPVTTVAAEFLQSYIREAQIPYDSKIFMTYAQRFFDTNMPRVRQLIIENSKGRARLLLPSMERLFRRFIKSLKHANFD